MTTTTRIDVPGAVLFGLALLLPPLQGMAWWLILPCLITLVAGWRLTAFVILMGSYLYAETLIAGVYLLLLTNLLLMSVLADRAQRFESNHQSTAFDRFKTVAGLLLLSLPFFVLLTGLLASAGARWTERQSSGAMQTGISDSLSPDSVTRLLASTDLALRVQFDGHYQQQPPPAEWLYWRGVVLENFDGKTWTRDPQLDLSLAALPTGVPDNTIQISYEVTQEPNRSIWLYGLHEAWVTLDDVYRDTRGVLVNRTPVRQRFRYPVESFVTSDVQHTLPASAQRQLDEITRARNLALSADSNPLSAQWASSLRAQFADDFELTKFVLEQFQINNFYYTVTPPGMASQGIDDFLFNQRQGFCGHYASALTFVLRAAGIPARVIGGYQGGEFNPYSNHLNVYQYHAHAWVEAWYADRGWVQLDPVAWVAPERITIGMDAWLQETATEKNVFNQWRDTFNQLPVIARVSDLLDAFYFQSDRWLFNEQGELRTDALGLWLEQRGLGELPIWLMAAVLLFVVLRALSLRGSASTPVPPVLRGYHQFNAAMDKQGLGCLPGETISGHLARIALARPHLLKTTEQLSDLLQAGIYGRATLDHRHIKQLFKQLQLANTDITQK
ncbi:DUF3488 domain-containing protein [Gammaproteobacteria bacterium LSUCC0112]|nr:DUF3488 domain-containing protein [Gammaproteobacteria bacterium LSUCC0112]